MARTAAPDALSLTAGDDRLVVDVARGGRLASLVAGGSERLLGVDEVRGPDERTATRVGWGWFLMAPWPGRLAGAAVQWGGSTRRVPATWGEHAIHGAAIDAPWRVLEQGSAHALLMCDLAAGGWPLGGTVRQRVELRAGELVLEAEITAGAESTPAALGWHPWFRRPPDGDMRVTIDADEVLELDDDLLPTGALRAADGALDLRRGPALGGRRLDDVYVDVRQPARVLWPDLRMDLVLDHDPSCYVVHTPAHAVCVEPQTAWPNPFALGATAGARALEPGTSLRARCAVQWSPTAADPERDRAHGRGGTANERLAPSTVVASRGVQSRDPTPSDDEVLRSTEVEEP